MSRKAHPLPLYQIGALPDSTLHIRISKNTGAGFFNDDWISLQDIEHVLAKGPTGQPLSAFLIEPLLRGRSVNTAPTSLRRV